MTEPPAVEPPRYLRFLAAMVLGTAAVAAPVVLGACDDEPPPADASVDSQGVVDGPLHPPDLPRRAAA